MTLTGGCLISREFVMPNPATFSIPPVVRLLKKWIAPEAVVIDPFARDSTWGTITNDLNPQTRAQHHMDAIAFTDWLMGDSVIADVVLFDPPYSPRQVSEVYEAVGIKAGMKDTQTARLYREVRDRLDAVLKPGGIAISFGWNSMGFGVSRGYEQQEILMLAHGGAHNDTIVVVEKKLPKLQTELF